MPTSADLPARTADLAGSGRPDCRRRRPDGRRPGSPQDEAAFDELEPLDPVDEELDELDDEPEDDPEEPDPESEDEDDEPDEDDSDLPAFTVLLVDVLRESVR
ncbi:hypothetical protein [Promicromonospora sp. NPDC059942]|uniref:hypothetical protein n=1 Tax=Promicromonospora sp. NPDC059942 TaxID=3347009 RepID=UPI003666AC32